MSRKHRPVLVPVAGVGWTVSGPDRAVGYESAQPASDRERWTEAARARRLSLDLGFSLGRVPHTRHLVIAALFLKRARCACPAHARVSRRRALSLQRMEATIAAASRTGISTTQQKEDVRVPESQELGGCRRTLIS